MTADYRQFINRNLPPIEKGCTSKAMFVTRGEARQYAKAASKRGSTVKPYHCRYYDHWHLGTPRHR